MITIQEGLIIMISLIGLLLMGYFVGRHIEYWTIGSWSYPKKYTKGKQMKFDNRYWWILVIPILFIILIFSVNPISNNSRDRRYCELGREVDKQTMELNPIFYDMQKQAENYLNGESRTGQTSGKLIQWSGDFDSYTCIYDFTVQIGNISQTIQVTHTFIGNELITWRYAKTGENVK